MKVFGYHGTSRANTESILTSGRGAIRGFVASENDTDWLGSGVYFFQDAPYRAREWPQVRLPRETRAKEVVVFRGELELSDCLDLIDIQASKFIIDAYPELRRWFRKAGLALPRNKGARRYFDSTLINYVVEHLERTGKTVACIRAAFEEGKPIVPRSGIYSHSNVQIVVRPKHSEVIKYLEIHAFEGEN